MNPNKLGEDAEQGQEAVEEQRARKKIRDVIEDGKSQKITDDEFMNELRGALLNDPKEALKLFEVSKGMEVIRATCDEHGEPDPEKIRRYLDEHPTDEEIA